MDLRYFSKKNKPDFNFNFAEKYEGTLQHKIHYSIYKLVRTSKRRFLLRVRFVCY